MRVLAFAGGLTPAELLDGPDTIVFDDMREPGCSTASVIKRHPVDPERPLGLGCSARSGEAFSDGEFRMAQPRRTSDPR